MVCGCPCNKVMFILNSHLHSPFTLWNACVTVQLHIPGYSRVFGCVTLREQQQLLAGCGLLWVHLPSAPNFSQNASPVCHDPYKSRASRIFECQEWHLTMAKGRQAMHSAVPGQPGANAVSCTQKCSVLHPEMQYLALKCTILCPEVHYLAPRNVVLHPEMQYLAPRNVVSSAQPEFFFPCIKHFCQKTADLHVEFHCFCFDAAWFVFPSNTKHFQQNKNITVCAAGMSGGGPEKGAFSFFLSWGDRMRSTAP